MPMPRSTLLPPVRTAEELSARWRLLLADDDPGDREPGRTDLWVQTYDADGRQQPALIVVEDVPELPDATFVGNLAGLVGDLLAEGTAGIGAVAFALSPAARRDVGAADLRWASDLGAACAAADVRVLGVHLVADEEVHRVV